MRNEAAQLTSLGIALVEFSLQRLHGNLRITLGQLCCRCSCRNVPLRLGFVVSELLRGLRENLRVLRLLTLQRTDSCTALRSHSAQSLFARVDLLAQCLNVSPLCGCKRLRCIALRGKAL